MDYKKDNSFAYDSYKKAECFPFYQLEMYTLAVKLFAAFSKISEYECENYMNVDLGLYTNFSE